MSFVSVIMPSYNTPYDYLKEAIESIRKQSHKDFELIIIDDGSTRFNDPRIINKFISGDKRIRFVKNTHKKGVAGALNTGLDEAIGTYIFRMDSDDISEYDRLERQIRFMDENDDVDIVAGGIKCFGASNRIEKSELTNAGIRTVLLFQSGLVHPTVCFRKSSLEKYSLRYAESMQSEDYELWTRCAMYPDIKFASLSDVVLHYRVHENQVTKQRNDIMHEQGKRIRLEYLNNNCIGVDHSSFITFIDYVMYDYKVKKMHSILKIEKDICESFCNQFDQTNKRICKRVFRKLCLKKAVSYVLKGDIKQIWVAMINGFLFITT